MHVGERIFVFGRAHERRQGSLSLTDFENWYFPIRILVEKCLIIFSW